MKNYIFAAILIIYACGFKLHAQSLPTTVTVHTPEVTAFNRNIETPVSMYSGVPNISIPLYTIKIKGVEVPITLDYHAGGIRVDQEASWVGLGWSLNYGGEISRVIRGAPDEKYFLAAATATNSASNINHFLEMPSPLSDIGGARWDALNSSKFGGNDLMPDFFFYSVLGHSGKFMFSQSENKFVLFPHDDLNIQQFSSPPNSLGVSTPLYKWTLQLEDGTAVDFGGDAFTSESPVGSVKNVGNSGWMIKAIRNIYNESITYNYQPLFYYTEPLNPENFSLLYNHSTVPSNTVTNAGDNNILGSPKLIPDPANNSNITRTPMQNQSTCLSTITFPAGSIQFLTTGRNDISNSSSSTGPSSTGSAALSDIRVYDNAGHIVKSIQFQYDYFYGDDNDLFGGQYDNNITNSDEVFGRLKLTGIIVDGHNYTFDYYTYPKMPSKFSSSQDHWGFYNGIANAGYYPLIPRFVMQPGYFNGGDRRVNPAVSNVFSLKSITYPEGGKKEFVYENNTAQVNDIPVQLLNYYQDDHILNNSAEISLSGADRMASNIQPDEVDANGIRYFYKYFSPNGIPFLNDGYGWIVNTNFALSSAEESASYLNSNAQCTIQGLVNSQWVDIRQFNSHPSANTFNGGESAVAKIDFQDDRPIGATQFRLKVALTYSGTSTGSSLENQPWTLDFKVNWRELDGSGIVNVGGIRIQNINSYLSDGTLAKKMHYDYVNPYIDPNHPALTSGKTVSFPGYFQYQQKIVAEGSNEYNIQYAVNFNSQSNQPLESTAGSFAGYEYVTETNVDVNNSANVLKSTSHFSFNSPYYSTFYKYMNMGSYEPSEWTRGKLLSKQYFSQNKLIRQEDYTYYDWSPNVSNATQEDYADEINTNLISYQYLGRIQGGYGDNYPADFVDIVSGDNANGGPISYAYDYLPYGCTMQWHYGADNYTSSSIWPFITIAGQVYDSCNSYQVMLPHFFHYTGFDKPKSKTVTSYDGASPIVQTENYFYDHTPDLYLLTRTQTTNSRNDLLETRLTYPIDSVATSVYSYMLSQHILDPVIVEAQYKNGNFLKSANTNYQIWSNQGIVAPIRRSTAIGNNGPIANITYSNYDNYGNVTSASQRLGANVAIQYGYNQQYPVAQAINVTNTLTSSANGVTGTKDFFYDGFEEGDGNSTSGDARTGHFSYTGTFTKTINNIDNGQYTLSYWLKSGSGWSMQSTAVAIGGNTYTINLTGQIDDVRLYPLNAQMLTYTYDALIGLTSQTDAKNLITFYEYDGSRRLINIKDKDGNIVKNIVYHYRGEADPNYSHIILQNVTGGAVSLYWTLPSTSPSTSCVMQYTDSVTGQVYSQSISTNQTGSATFVVQAGGRSYSFRILQTLSSGQQISSQPLVVNVPAWN